MKTPFVWVVEVCSKSRGIWEALPKAFHNKKSCVEFIEQITWQKELCNYRAAKYTRAA